MASTTTSPALAAAGALKPGTIDPIGELGTACHFPPAMVTSARMLLGQVKYPDVFSHGRTKLLAAACLCVVARFAHQLFSLHDLARVAVTDRGAINRMAHRLQSELGLRRPPADLRLVVPQLCEALGVPVEAREAAAQLAGKLHARMPPALQGRLPSVIATAVVYAACEATDRKMTYTACARAAHVAISATNATHKILQRVIAPPA